MDYRNEANLRDLAALTPEERARSAKFEASDPNLRELRAEIDKQTDPQKRAILQNEYNRLTGQEYQPETAPQPPGRRRSLADADSPRYVPADDLATPTAAPAPGERTIKRSKAYLDLIAGAQEPPAEAPPPSTMERVGQFAKRTLGDAAEAATSWATKDRPAPAPGQVGAVGAAGDQRSLPGMEPEPAPVPPNTYQASGPGGVLRDIRDNEAARAQRLAPQPPKPASVLQKPDGSGVQVPDQAGGFTPQEMAEGSIAPWKLEEQRRMGEYVAPRNPQEARPFDTAQNIAQNVREFTDNPVARGAVAGFSQLGQTGIGAVRLAADLVGAEDVASFSRGASRIADTVGQGATSDLKGNDKLVADVFSSILNSGPAVAVGSLGGPGLTTLFAQSTLAEYNAGRDAGFDVGASLGRAGIMGTAEALGERFGFSEQLKLIKAVTKGLPQGELAKVMGAMLMKEIPGEQLTTAMQFLADKVGPAALRPNATIEDYLNAAGETLKVTVAQTAVMGGGPAAIVTGRNQAAAADRAIERSAMTQAERAAQDAGFLRPVERRKQLDTSLDDLAAEYGISPKAVKAIREQAARKPLDQLAGFYKRAVQSLAKLGLTGKPVDEAGLGVLDQPPPQASAAVPRETPQESVSQSAAPADDTGPIPAEEVLGTPAEEAAPVPAPQSSQDLAGEQINRNWTAFAPESGSLNLPREQLPQIKAEHRGALVNFLGARGVTHETDAELDPRTLKPTQAEFSPAKVQKAREFEGGDRSILVSSDGYVLDGHHQWLAKLDAGQPVKAIRLNAPIQDLLRLAHQFPSSTTARGATRATPINAGAPTPQPASGDAVADGPAAVAPAPNGEVNEGSGKARTDTDSRVSSVERRQESLQQPEQQGLPAVRGPWNPNGAGMGGQFSGVSGRDRATPDSQTLAGSDRQQSGLSAGQRPVGDRQAAGREPANNSDGARLGRADDYDGVDGEGRGFSNNDQATNESRRVAREGGNAPAGRVAAQRLGSDVSGPDAIRQGMGGRTSDTSQNPGASPEIGVAGRRSDGDPAGARVLTRVGKTPRASEIIELRANPDGTLTPYIGRNALLDFNTAEPITLPGDVSDLDAKKAIRAAGAVSDRTRFFPAGAAADQAAADLEAGLKDLGGVMGKGERRRGEVGGKLSSGEIVLTASGRETTPFPQVKVDTDRKATATVKAVDQWLMQNALAEAEARGDEFNARQFRANMARPSPSDKDSAEEYLFGEQPTVQPSILKPLTPAASPAPAPSATQAQDQRGEAVAQPADASQQSGQPVQPNPRSNKVDQRAARAKARMAFDPQNDTVLQALAKMGGIRRDVVASEFGLKPEELKHTVKVGGLNGFPFRKTGGIDLDRAMTALREAGYFTGVADEDVRAAFEQAIYDELGGGRNLTVQGQMADAQRQAEERAQEEEAAARAEYDAEAQAEREAIMAEAGLTEQDMAALDDDDLDIDAQSNVSTEAFMRSMGFTDQEIQDALAEEARRADGRGQEAGQAAGEEARAPAGAGSEQAGRGAAEDEGLTLEAQTADDLKAKTEREEAAARAEKAQRDAEQARLKKEADDRDARARADATVDDFQLGQSAEQQMSGMGDLFTDAPSENPKSSPAGDEKLPTGLVEIPADADAVAEAMQDMAGVRDQADGERERLYAMFGPQDERVSLPRIMGGKVPAGVEFLTPEQAKAKVDEWKAEADRQNKKLAGPNGNRVVISLFDASGVLAEPWHRAGYRVFNYDLQLGHDISEFNAENLLEQHGNDEVFAILAQPPCTDFAASGARWWKDKDEDGRTKASTELVMQVLRTVELFRPSVWVMENPVGRIQEAAKLPDPTLQFDPWHYGDPYTKRTLLWGRFDPNLPTAMVEPTDGSKMHRMSSSAKYERSLTSEPFAYAFFMANNADAMGPAGRLAAEFAGVERELFDAAVAAGHSEYDIRSAVDDPYYENDLETVREELAKMAPTPPTGKGPDAEIKMAINLGDPRTHTWEEAAATKGSMRVEGDPDELARVLREAGLSFSRRKTGVTVPGKLEQARAVIVGTTWRWPGERLRIDQTLDGKAQAVITYPQGGSAIIGLKSSALEDRLAEVRREVEGTGRKLADLIDRPKPFVAGEQAWPLPNSAASRQGKAEAAPSRAEKAAERLTDAGEELIRNRRGKLKGLAWDDVSAMNDTLKVAQVVKANVWPRPDYAKMVEDGAPAWKAAALKAVYDKLAAAPVTRAAPTDADLRAYIETMQGVREALTAELDRVAALPDGAELWKSIKAENVFGKVFPLPADARAVYGRPSPFDRSSEQGKENNRRALLIGGNNAVQAMQFGYKTLGKIKDLLAEGFPAKQEAWQKSWEVRATETRDNDIPETERTGQPQPRFYVYEKGSRWRLAKGGQDGGYATQEQAEAFARSLTQKKREQLPPSRGLDLAEVKRTGPDWRSGKNVTAQDIMDHFGFRGVNLGEYVKAKQSVAQLHLNHIFDAMSDLADLLGVPPKAMSLNGTLGVAIGAQGSGKALAHFVPGVNEINITRDSGAGALAHEFGHALDHYFAAQHGKAVSMAKRPYLSAAIEGMSDPGGVRPEVIEAMRHVMRTINTRPMTEVEAKKYMADQRELNQRRLDRWVKEFKGNKGADPAALDAVAEKLKRGDVGEPQDADVETNLAEFMRAAGLKPGNAIAANAFTIAYRLRDLADEARFLATHIPQQPTDYARASDAMDAKKREGDGYWSTSWEKFARAFETFAMDALKDRQRESLYLSGLVDSAGWADWSAATGKSIPYPAGDERLAMQQAFQKLVDAIETRETDSGVMLYDLPRRQTDTPEFKRWFGDSKVVDEQGKPLVVYHGTRADIQAFAGDKVKARFPNSEGFYFTSSPRHASVYADSINNAAEDFDPASRFAKPVAEGANVMPSYVSLQNPKVLTVSEWGTLESRVDGDGGATVRAARAAGHDGVIVRRRAGDEYDGDLVIAFKPEQIKSAIGNRGTFDPASADIALDLSRVGDRIMRMGYERQDTERIQAARQLAGLIKRLDEGKITQASFEAAVRGLAARMDRVVTTKAANRLMSERERGPDYVRERLLRARRQGDLDHETVEFALWALDQNPALANNLAISVRAAKDGQAAGDYNPAAEIIRLFKGSSNEDTAVHEILHHAERMMPADMQAAVRKEWAAALAKAVKNATPEQRAVLEQIGAALAGDQAAYKALTAAIMDGPLNYADHYQLVNPSEYWAVNGARLLGNRYLAKDSIWQRVRNWFREMEQKLRGLLGLPSDAPLLRALNYVIDPANFGPDRGGRFESSEMLSDRKAMQAMGDVLPNVAQTDPEARALKALSETDELFALPKSEADTIEGITFDNNPIIKVRETKLPGNERMWTLTMPDGRQARITVRKPSKYGPSPYSADFDGVGYSWNTERPGENADSIDPDTEDVWIDVSQLKGKGDGAMVYNIASTFAHNTGRIFIGDPNGVSSDAMRRRPQHMLSSALKFGTTAHLAPHPDQVRGSRQYGVPPLDWVYGDDLGNIRKLVDLNLRLVENSTDGSRVPTFDPNTGAFVEPDATDRVVDGQGRSGVQADPTAGRDVGDRGVADQRGMQDQPGGSAGGNGSSLAGSRTRKRVAVLRALLREEGSGVEGQNGRRDGLLARLVRQQAVHPEATRGLFYQLSRPKAEGQGEQQNLVAPPPADTSASPPKPPSGQRSLPLRHEPGWQMPEGSRFDDFVYKFQDKQIDLKRAIKAIREAVGAIEDRWDAYLQEELFHGRAAKRTQDFVNNELEPLMREMRLRELSMDELDQYLHARHAKEANAVIAERNPDLPDGGSGMTNAEADAYMAGLDESKRRRLEAVAAKVDAIIAGTRNLYVTYGLESKSTVDGWAGMFKHYVPLMREDKDGGMGIGQGFSIKGPESKHRTGSTRKVVDILANVALQRERAIVRGEKNRVAVSLAGLVKLNPNPEVWEFGVIPSEQVFNPKTGQVETRMDPLYKSRPNVLIAKIVDKKGEVHERAVVFNESNERAMRMVTALKNLDAAHIEGLLGISATITRYFAAINTQYNPVFGVVNLVRDVQGAAINLTNTPLAGQRAEVMKRAMSALKGIYADARAVRAGQPANSRWAKLWEEFQGQGGQTGFRDLYLTSADRAEGIKDALDPYNWMNGPWGKLVTVNGALKAPAKLAQDFAVAPLFNWLSDYNLSMENAVRLSAYELAIERGMSRQQAASLAKNLTVNFNRKGQVGQQVGALYAFFNASMQGTARMANVLFDMKAGDIKSLRLSSAGKMIVGGGIMLGVLQALALAAAGFDDNEPPEFVRERSLIIPLIGTDKKYITIPMPLGWHVLPNIGRIATELAMSGFKDTAKHVTKLVSIFAEAFNPIGNAGLSLQTIAPTAIDPFAALSENRDWAGKPIARESFDKAQPGHALAKDTATSYARAIAEAINWMSGGTQYKAGAFSPTPDQIDYLIGQVTGGVGREVSKLDQAVGSAFTGEELPPHKIPLLGRFYGDAKNQAGEAGAFYDSVRRMAEHEAQIKGLAKAASRETDERRKQELLGELKEYREDNPEADLFRAANGYERTIQRLRAQKRELVKDGASRERIREVEEVITKTMREFNERVKLRRQGGTAPTSPSEAPSQASAPKLQPEPA